MFRKICVECNQSATSLTSNIANFTEEGTREKLLHNSMQCNHIVCGKNYWHYASLRAAFFSTIHEIQNSQPVQMHFSTNKRVKDKHQQIVKC